MFVYLFICIFALTLSQFPSQSEVKLQRPTPTLKVNSLESLAAGLKDENKDFHKVNNL